MIRAHFSAPGRGGPQEGGVDEGRIIEAEKLGVRACRVEAAGELADTDGSLDPGRRSDFEPSCHQPSLPTHFFVSTASLFRRRLRPLTKERSHQ